MPDSSKSIEPQPQTSGLAFLEEMESRHTYVLDELEALNARIEKVLDECSHSRHRTKSDGEEQDSGSGNWEKGSLSAGSI